MGGFGNLIDFLSRDEPVLLIGENSDLARRDRKLVDSTTIQINDGGVNSTLSLSVKNPLILNFTPGSIIFAGSSGELAQDNANLFFDDLQNRVGIGTNAPLVPLHVVGQSLLGGNVTIGLNAAANYKLTFDGLSNDGVITFQHTDGRFDFSKAISIAGPGQFLNLESNNEIRFEDADRSHYSGFKANAVTTQTDLIWVLPAADGAPNQFLKTDGSKTLSWSSAAGGEWTDAGPFIYPSEIADNVIIGAATEGAATINLNANGSATFNSQGDAVNFVVQGDNDPTALVLDGTNDRLGVGTATPGRKLGVVSGDAIVSRFKSSVANAKVSAEDDTTTNDTQVYWGATANTLKLGAGATDVVTSSSTEFKVHPTLVADSNIVLEGEAATSNELHFREATNNGTNYTGLRAAVAIGSDQTFILPSIAGTPNQFLQTDGASPVAELAWATPPGGSGTSEWSDGGTFLYPNETGDNVIIGDSVEANAHINLNANGSAIFNNQGAAVDFRVEASGQPNGLLLDGTTANLGVGTGTATHRLTVVGTATPIASFSTSAANARVTVKDATTSDTDQVYLGATGNDMRLGTSGADRVTLSTTEVVVSSGADVRLVDGNLVLNGAATTTNETRYHEATNNGTNYVALRSQAVMPGDITFELPDSVGTPGQVLQTDGTPSVAKLSWTTVIGGGSSEWTDAGTFLYPDETGDNVIIGAATEAAATINLNADGSAIFNNQGGAVNFTVEGSGQPNAIFLNGTTSNLGIGTGTPGDKLHVNGDLRIGTGVPGKDYIITFVGESNTGTVTYMEDEDRHDFSNHVLLQGTLGVGVVPVSSKAHIDGDLRIGTGGAGIDYQIFFNGQTNDGTITYVQASDRFDFDNNVDVSNILSAGKVRAGPLIPGSNGRVLEVNSGGSDYVATFHSTDAMARISMTDDTTGSDQTVFVGAIGNSFQIGANSVTYTWPTSDGSNDFVLTTNGAGALSWTAKGGGGTSEWFDEGSYLRPDDASGDEDIVIGTGTQFDGARITAKKSGPAFSGQNLTDSADVQIAVFRSGDRLSPIDNDAGHVSFFHKNDAGNQVEFSRLTSKATAVAAAAKNSELTVGVMLANSLTGGAVVHGTGIRVPEHVQHDGDTGTHLRFDTGVVTLSATNVAMLTATQTSQNTFIVNPGKVDVDFTVFSDDPTDPAIDANGDTGNVGIGIVAGTEKLRVNGDIAALARGDVRFYDADNTNWVAFQAALDVTPGNVTWTLPATDGSTNQALSTNGSGTLFWQTVATSLWTDAGAFTHLTSLTDDVVVGGNVVNNSARFTASKAGTAFSFHNTTNSNSVQVGVLRAGNHAAISHGYLGLMNQDSVGAQAEFARFGWRSVDRTAASKDGELELDVMVNNVSTRVFDVHGTGVRVHTTIQHLADIDTEILFADDKVSIKAGGLNMVDFTQDATSEVVFNPGSENVNFKVNYDLGISIDSNGGTGNVGIKQLADASDALRVAGDVGISAQADLKLYATNNTNFVALQAASVVSLNKVYTWPAADGGNRDFMVTNGAGVLSFIDINDLTAITVDGTADYLMIWDATDSTHKKVLVDNLLQQTTLADEPFITHAASGTLSDERVLTGTTNQIAVDFTPPNATLSAPQDLHTAADFRVGTLRVNTAVNSRRVEIAGGAEDIVVHLSSTDETTRISFSDNLTGGDSNVYVGCNGNTLQLGSAGATIVSCTSGEVVIQPTVDLKTTGDIWVQGNSTTTNEIRFYESSNVGTNYVGFKAQASFPDNHVWELPAATGIAGQVLTRAGAGTRTEWETPPGSLWTDGGDFTYLTQTGDRVGIGTATPEANSKLHIKAGVSGALAPTAGSTLVLEAAGGNFVTFMSPADGASGEEAGIRVATPENAEEAAILWDNSASPEQWRMTITDGGTGTQDLMKWDEDSVTLSRGGITGGNKQRLSFGAEAYIALDDTVTGNTNALVFNHRHEEGTGGGGFEFQLGNEQGSGTTNVFGMLLMDAGIVSGQSLARMQWHGLEWPGAVAAEIRAQTTQAWDNGFQAGSQMIFATHADGVGSPTPDTLPAIDRCAIDQRGNFILGDPATLTVDASAAGTMVFKDTASIPGGAPDGHVYLYAKEVGSKSKLFARDEDAETPISPHDDSGDWVFRDYIYSRKRHRKINMIKLIRALEEHLGEKFIEEFYE